MVTNSLLEVENLSKVYSVRGRDSVALEPCTFSLAQGESLGIVGESGSGKSTLVRLIAGLDRPTTGRVLFQGEPLPQGGNLGSRRSKAQRVQMVFQDPFGSLDPRQKLGDCLKEVIRVHGVRKGLTADKYAAWLLNEVGLSGSHIDSYPRALSGGQRQRFSIARALAPQPHVLILDEAVSALDVSVQAQILLLLEGLRATTGIAYLFVTHDLAVARQVCDSAIVMRRGAIVESGSMENIIDHPSETYTQRLVASVPTVGWVPPTRGAAQAAATTE